ncbi:hypothetical protein PF005_g14503 [Phytophthora fragariae]|uniref:Uncharacterized protein n=1 Tax=Phytophthora fragariae TaxID=53985 RepID=A0A6A3XH74_9STRA|nr:hypothetical protein PF011_g13534 [Phytophthora fragariae]KAE9170979.1 hypothetical protein PF004_g27707 [Phytophthora fragariae]KAE9202606.1 hypothetical protein PF005_g14503 [Phytophthora fragariae]
MKNETVKQRLPYEIPYEKVAVEQELPHDDAAELETHEDVQSITEAIEASPCPSGPAPTPTESVGTVEYVDGAPNRNRVIEGTSPPRDAKSITSLLGLSWKKFLRDLKAGDIEQVCLITDVSARRALCCAVLGALKASGNPIYKTAREFADAFPDKIPAELPADRGVRHEIDFAPGSKYCLTRQWPLPRDQAKAIDDFFEGRRQAGHVRESILPHSSPTFCVNKTTIVHAFNKLNDTTIPAQTPIPRKQASINMGGPSLPI